MGKGADSKIRKVPRDKEGLVVAIRVFDGD
jgi:hypothetical protein